MLSCHLLTCRGVCVMEVRADAQDQSTRALIEYYRANRTKWSRLSDTRGAVPCVARPPDEYLGKRETART